MLKNLKDIADFEVGSLVGVVSGMSNMDDGTEQFFRDELKKLVSNLAKLSYQEALNDIKSSADKLAQEKLWEA